MSISEKIYTLRKQNNLTQEQLAEECKVSRQAVSKWESGTIYPDIDKIILLSRKFKVSIDLLVKDELVIESSRNNHSCHCNESSKQLSEFNYYEGILIKESISDEIIIDLLNVTKVELWKTDSNPKYWTALYFSSNTYNFPELLSHNIKSEGNWYVDFRCQNIKYIVFRNQIFKYTVGNGYEKNKVLENCKALGIPENQLNWQE